MKRWPDKIKKKAINLRKEGLSYGEICAKLFIPKSTLFSWIYDLKRPDEIVMRDKIEHLKRIRPLAIKAKKMERQKRLDEIKKKVVNEISTYNFDDKKLLQAILSMLYWAEGAKGRGVLSFVNTDPNLALLYLTLLRKCHNIDENKLRIRLHLHYYHKIKETRTFWSSLLSVSESKFGKIYIKKRSKTKRFRKNYFGICFIRYYDENLRYEILERARVISNALNRKNVPIAQLDRARPCGG